MRTVLLTSICLTNAIAPPVPAQSRDSAGIRIVENSAPAWTAGNAWRVDTTPTFRAVLASGPAQAASHRRINSRIQGAIRLSDGRIAVANGHTYQIELFDRTGRRPDAIGRQGKGPGEFIELHEMCAIRGDTLMVLNFLEGLNVFAPTGSYVRIVRPDTGALTTRFGSASLLGCFADGSFVLTSGGNAAQRLWSDNWTDSTRAYVFDAQGNQRGIIGPLPSMRWVHVANQQRGMLFGPFGVFAFDGQSIYYGFPERFEIKIFSQDGRLTRIVRRQFNLQPVTAQDIRAFRELSSSTSTGVLDAVVAAAAKNHPAFEGLMIDALKNIWVREVSLPFVARRLGDQLPASRWTVFDERGRWLGAIQLPERFTPMEIGADYVLGTTRDDNDLEYAVMFPLTKPRA
jgi:hypothetical protein